jgi:hypothetical protein
VAGMELLGERGKEDEVEGEGGSVKMEGTGEGTVQGRVRGVTHHDLSSLTYFCHYLSLVVDIPLYAVEGEGK